MKFAVLSDTGRERENNEDRALALPERGLFVIADGMGGHVAGEVASRVAAESFVAAVREQPRPPRIRDELEVLAEAIERANRAVVQEAKASGLQGMGTTLTAALLRGRTASFAHVGDTRAYFVRERLLRLATQDQTVVGLMVRSGMLDSEEARTHPERHMLLQAMGTQDDVEPDLFSMRIPHGARVLLSSDGLHDILSSEQILKLAQEPKLETAAARLVEAANAAGGPDNITVIVIDP